MDLGLLCLCSTLNDPRLDPDLGLLSCFSCLRSQSDLFASPLDLCKHCSTVFGDQLPVPGGTTCSCLPGC